MQKQKMKIEKYYRGKRPEMIRYVPLNAVRLLEVGCGEGEFGKLLKTKRNVEIWGVEIIEEVALRARGNLDKVLVGDFEKDEVNMPTNYFHGIIFNDVLEHFIDPCRVLLRARKYLVDDGYIIASIPNVRFFGNFKDLVLNKKWEYADCGVLDNTHLRFFTESTIRDLFGKTGFDILTCEGINSERFPWKFKIFNFLCCRIFDDLKFLQFACLAQKKSNFYKK